MQNKRSAIFMMTFIGIMFSVSIAKLHHTNNVTPLVSTIETINYEDIHGTKPYMSDVEVEIKTNIAVGLPIEQTTEISTKLSEEMVTETITSTETTIKEIKDETIEETTTTSTRYNNRWGVSLTGKEIDLLARILWLEARGESKEGQEAVVEVIFNRMVNQSKDLKSILSAKNQFSTWKYRNTAKNYGTQVEIVKEVLQGKTNILEEDVLYFAMWPLGKNVVKIIGSHYFSTDWCEEVANRKGK